MRSGSVEGCPRWYADPKIDAVIIHCMCSILVYQEIIRKYMYILYRSCGQQI